MRKPIKTRKHRARKNRVRKHKVRKHKTRKHRVRKHRVPKHNTRKHKVRKHKTRKHKVRKHKVRKHNGGGEGQPQESLSDCALTCQEYKVGDVIKYTRYRMGVGFNDITGTIIKIGKPSDGRNIGVCCYTIETIGVGGRPFHLQVHCDDPSIRKQGEDMQEPVRRSLRGLNQGTNPQQSFG